jgi:hypothetical protein
MKALQIDGVEKVPERGITKANSLGRSRRGRMSLTSDIAEGGVEGRAPSQRRITRASSRGRSGGEELTSTEGGVEEGLKTLSPPSENNRISQSRRSLRVAGGAQDEEKLETSKGEASKIPLEVDSNDKDAGGALRSRSKERRRSLTRKNSGGSSTMRSRAKEARPGSTDDDNNDDAGTVPKSEPDNKTGAEKDEENVSAIREANGIARRSSSSERRSQRVLRRRETKGSPGPDSSDTTTHRMIGKKEGTASKQQDDSVKGEIKVAEKADVDKDVEVVGTTRSGRVVPLRTHSGDRLVRRSQSGGLVHPSRNDRLGSSLSSFREPDLLLSEDKEKVKESTASKDNKLPQLDGTENPANALLRHIDANFHDLIVQKEENLTKREKSPPQRRSQAKHTPSLVKSSELIKPVPATNPVDSIDWHVTAEDTAEVDAFFRQMKGQSPTPDKTRTTAGARTNADSFAKGLNDSRTVKKGVSAWDIMADDSSSADGDECAALPSFSEDKRQGGRKIVRKAKPKVFDDDEPCPSLAPPSLAGDERVGGGDRKILRRAKSSESPNLAPPSLAGDERVGGGGRIIVRRAKSSEGPNLALSSLAPPSLAGDEPRRNMLRKPKSAPKVDPALKKKANLYGSLDSDDNSLAEDEPEVPVKKCLRRIVRAKTEDTTSCHDATLAPPRIVISGTSDRSKSPGRRRLEKSTPPTTTSQRISLKVQSARNLFTPTKTGTGGGENGPASLRRTSSGIKKPSSLSRIIKGR